MEPNTNTNSYRGDGLSQQHCGRPDQAPTTESSSNTNTLKDIWEIFVVQVIYFILIFKRYLYDILLNCKCFGKSKLGANISTTWNKNSSSLSFSCPTNLDLIFPIGHCHCLGRVTFRSKKFGPNKLFPDIDSL